MIKALSHRQFCTMMTRKTMNAIVIFSLRPNHQKTMYCRLDWDAHVAEKVRNGTLKVDIA
jgi:hypothetical protein